MQVGMNSLHPFVLVYVQNRLKLTLLLLASHKVMISLGLIAIFGAVTQVIVLSSVIFVLLNFS